MKRSIIGSLLFIAQFLNVPISAKGPGYTAVLLEGNASTRDTCTTTLEVALFCQ